MSTRSIIFVIGASVYGKPENIRLYKHSDGYPSEVLDGLANAIAMGKALVAEDNEKWKTTKKDATKLCSSTLVGMLIGEFTTVYGMGAQIDSEVGIAGEGFEPAIFHEPFTPKQLGEQSDLEWMYIIDLNKKNVSVYSDAKTWKTDNNDPQNMLASGIANPFTEADGYVDEAKPRTIEEISHAIKAIEATGFTFNKETTNETNSKSAKTRKGSAKTRPAASKGKTQSRAGRSSVGTSHSRL